MATRVRPAGRRTPGLRGPADADPSGLGIAVVFDWALTTQLASQAAVSAVRHGSLGGVVGRLVAAAMLLVLGEALRRGRRAAWVLQLALLALVTLGGLSALPDLVRGHLGRASILSVLVELSYAPWLLWRLLLPRSIRWFGHAGRRTPRTSGRWLPVLIIWSVAWGVAVAVSQAL